MRFLVRHSDDSATPEQIHELLAADSQFEAVPLWMVLWDISQDPQLETRPVQKLALEELKQNWIGKVPESDASSLGSGNPVLEKLSSISPDRRLSGILPVVEDVTDRIFAPGDASVLGSLLDVFLGVGAAQAQTVVPEIPVAALIKHFAGESILAALPEEPVAVVITESWIQANETNLAALRQSLRPKDRVIVIDDPKTELDAAAGVRQVLRGTKTIVKSLATDNPLAAQIEINLKGIKAGFNLQVLTDSIAVPGTKQNLISTKWDETAFNRADIQPELAVQAALSYIRAAALVKDPSAQRLLLSKAGIERRGNDLIIGKQFVEALLEVLQTQYQSDRAVSQAA